MVKDDLGKRMKGFYEEVSRTRLVRRIPVAIRIDGKAFHTFTKNLKKPFDDVLTQSMQKTMQYLCKNIQGCIFGYTQSDEITLILQDYKTLDTCAWFDYEVQKMCSIASSMATMYFNKTFLQEIALVEDALKTQTLKDADTYVAVLKKAADMGAMFDARAFNIPKEEVCNLVYWRQIDAQKNAISMVARAYFTEKELDRKGSKDKIEMLKEHHGISIMEEYPVYQMRGTSCIRKEYEKDGVVRHKWVLDKEMPLLVGENREYLDKLVYMRSEV